MYKCPIIYNINQNTTISLKEKLEDENVNKYVTKYSKTELLLGSILIIFLLYSNPLDCIIKHLTRIKHTIQIVINSHKYKSTKVIFFNIILKLPDNIKLIEFKVLLKSILVKINIINKGMYEEIYRYT